MSTTQPTLDRNRIDSGRPTADTPHWNTVLCGDCAEVLTTVSADTVGLVIADPPYLANYRPRDGRSYLNDDNDRWLRPAFAEVFRVLRPNRFCVCFYGWPRADRFFAAWRAAGFRPVGHLVFVKRYTSKTRLVRYQHEQAYLLAKGWPAPRPTPIADVITWEYAGNVLHPAQKPVSVLTPLIQAFSYEGNIVLDPFCGSGSALVAAVQTQRRFLGIDIDPRYHAIATERLRGLVAGGVAIDRRNRAATS